MNVSPPSIQALTSPVTAFATKAIPARVNHPKLLPATLIATTIIAAAVAWSATCWAEPATALDTPQPAPRYFVIDLGPLGGNSTESVGRAINERSQIVGRSYSPGFSVEDAVIWQNGNNPVRLLIGTGGTSAYGINNRGQMVGATGETSVTITDHQAVYWPDVRHPAITLAIPAGMAANGLEINERGQIVGNLFTEDPNFFRVLFWANSSSSPVQLSGLPGLVNSGLGARHCLNDFGQVAGGLANEDSSVNHAAFWASSSSLPVDLGTPGGDLTQTFAEAINNRGQIVGQALNDSFTVTRAVFWANSRSPVVKLRALNNVLVNTDAEGINLFGEIVGYAINADATIQHAVYWANSRSPATDLNDRIPANSGWLLQEAVDINASGVIIGSGTIGGHTHGFALIPRDRERD